MNTLLAVRDLRVSYGALSALRGVTLDVCEGELVCILGPSGCGKSTLLRAIAGLEPIAGGEVRIAGRSVGDLKPSDRDVGFVFQNYALYPNMTARANIAAPLWMTRLSALQRLPLLWRLSPVARTRRAEIAAQVAQTARMLELEALLERRPSQLSGGQRQRVALGRALAREPSLALLDEPLANLDAGLRLRTRSELKRVQRKTGATMLFVTHDQQEAMAIGDRVAVMFHGAVRQIDAPHALHRDPADLDVARFLAQPRLNEVDPDLARTQIGVAAKDGPVCVGGAPLAEAQGVITFHPEDAALRPPDRPGLPGLACTVRHVEHAGRDAHVFVRVSDGSECVARVSAEAALRWAEGDAAVLHFRLDAARVYPKPPRRADAADLRRSAA